MFEKRHQEVIPRRKFALRLLKSLGAALLLIFFALAVGIAGYHWIVGLGWIDSLLNASMILGGMGPVDHLETPAGKIFASLYALYSGVLLLASVGVLAAPLLHRFMHRFHLAQEEDVEEEEERREGG